MKPSEQVRMILLQYGASDSRIHDALRSGFSVEANAYAIQAIQDFLDALGEMDPTEAGSHLLSVRCAMRMIVARVDKMENRLAAIEERIGLRDAMGNGEPHA